MFAAVRPCGGGEGGGGGGAVFFGFFWGVGFGFRRKYKCYKSFVVDASVRRTKSKSETDVSAGNSSLK